MLAGRMLITEYIKHIKAHIYMLLPPLVDIVADYVRPGFLFTRVNLRSYAF